MLSSLHLRISNKLYNTLRICFQTTHHYNANNTKLRDISAHDINHKINNNTNNNDLSDTFGTLVKSKLYMKLNAEYLPEDDDGYDTLEIKRGFKVNEIGYRKLLEKLLIKSKPIRLTEALETYDRMTREDRIPPSKPMYTLMINGCAKCGYTKKAFEFFDELVRYELKPTKATVTALFNACAQCPQTNTEFALKKAFELREYLLTEGYVFQSMQYHSMIKAFAKLGDMKTAYEIVNEMIADGHPTTSQTYAMLLMGCISNTSSGLFDAIQIIRKMKYHSIPFNIYIYNLLLRTIRDCNIGSEYNLDNIIREWNRIPNFSKLNQNKSNINYNDNYQMFRKTNNEIKNEISISGAKDSKALMIPNAPNLLYFNTSEIGKVIAVDRQALEKAENRLMLFGGMKGYLQMMDKDKVIPNINTFTLLVELMHFDEESKTELFQCIERNKVNLDTDFFNILIKKCNFNAGINEAKQLLVMMQKRGLEPNIMTYGVLAIGCNNFSLAKQLISEMDKSGFRANRQIIGALVRQATYIFDFNYLNYLINYMKDNDVEPNSSMIEMIEAVKADVQYKLAKYDRQNSGDIPDRCKSERFRKIFANFKSNYNSWLEKVNVEQEQHPWKQFQIQKNVDGLQKFHDFKKFMRQKLDAKERTFVK